MDYFVVTTDSKLSEKDDELLSLMTVAEISKYGLLVSTDIDKFENDMLILLTTISIGKVADPVTKRAEPKKLLVFLSKTAFNLQNGKLFKSGVTDAAVTAFETMITVAQAHGYGAFNQTIRQMQLPLLPMEISPIDSYLEGITELLATIEE
ncbi:hypothetical protein [Dyadobacter fanqingshengii]|nr:hypothetical protein [Dyadobacter fanqingshengii]USJ34740.1 hypothetical protein NFI81_18755 [Dyadobacter fanqingshengii]